MSTEQESGIILPSNPEDRQKIKMAVKEISNSLTRIEGEKEAIKNSVELISKEHELPKPMVNKIARWYHKQNAGVDIGQLEDAHDLYETIFGIEEEGQE
jgi:hypothetical protein